MNLTHHTSVLRNILLLTATLLAGRAFGLGADYPNDRPTGHSGAWPPGMESLVNSTNRVHGFFVNAEEAVTSIDPQRP